MSSFLVGGGLPLKRFSRNSTLAPGYAQTLSPLRHTVISSPRTGRLQLSLCRETEQRLEAKLPAICFGSRPETSTISMVMVQALFGALGICQKNAPKRREDLRQ